MANVTYKNTEVALPSSYAANPEGRANNYGEIYANGLSLDRMAREGSLYSSRNATQGTGIAQTTNTTSDTTKPFIVMSMGAQSLVPIKKSLHLISLRMRPTAVSSGQTIQTIDIVTCTGNAYSSAGTDYNVAASNIATAGYLQHNTATAVASALQVFRVGVPVTVLGSNSRNVARFVPRQTTIPVIGDQYIMRFGGSQADMALPVSVVEPVSTTVNDYSRDFAPVIVGPGDSLLIIPWATGVLGAMSWEFEIIWAEL